MSAHATPITPAAFAAALPALPLSTLFAKAAELRNSIAHLEISNEQLQSFAAEGDKDCQEALSENVEVKQRMRDRINLLKAEVEGRGVRWDDVTRVEEQVKESEKPSATATQEANLQYQEESSMNGSSVARGGSIGDQELARRLRQQIDELENEDEDGLHL